MDTNSITVLEALTGFAKEIDDLTNSLRWMRGNPSIPCTEIRRMESKLASTIHERATLEKMVIRNASQP